MNKNVHVRAEINGYLSSFLSIMLMDDFLTGVREQAPHCVLFADDIAQMRETHADVDTHLGHLQQAPKPNGLQIDAGA